MLFLELGSYLMLAGIGGYARLLDFELLNAREGIESAFGWHKRTYLSTLTFTKEGIV